MMAVLALPLLARCDSRGAPPADGRAGTATDARVAASRDSGLGADGLRARRVVLDGAAFDVVEVDARTHALAIHWRDASGRRIGSLGRLRELLRAEGREMRFATNAGMFTPEFAPVGLYVEEGVERVPLNVRDSAGNFYLKPNGVFFAAGDSVRVMETAAFRARGAPGVTLATQSGPLLVHRGRIHPAFRAGSDNRYIRSGVGVRDGHIAVFAISRQEVDFHTFARLFLDELGCRGALFLDGAISRMYAPALQRRDDDGDFAGIISASVPIDSIR